MQIAIVLFDRFTALDAVGPYEMLSRVPGAETVFVAERPGAVRNDSGSLALVADRALADVPAPDVVVVPGGPGQSAQMENGELLGRLRAADAASTWTASVCTGSLLLAAAGLLTGRLCHLALAGPGHPADPRGRADGRAGGHRRQVRHRRGRLHAASTWVSPCSAGSRATNTPGPSSC